MAPFVSKAVSGYTTLLKMLLLAVLMLVAEATSVAQQQRDIKSFTLRGILVSDSNRIALLNGRSVRAGDIVDGIEVVEIGDRSVVLRARSEHFRLHVGAKPVRTDFRPNTGQRPVMRAAVPPAKPEPAQSSAAGLGDADPRDGRVRVQPGDTLSGIAANLLQSTLANSQLSLHQVMTALYSANPHAFNGNMDDLWAGKALAVPPLDTPQWLASSNAGSNRDSDREASTQNATATQPPIQKPGLAASVSVAEGDNLSSIAIRLIRSSTFESQVSLDQLMVALFENNRTAFGNNVNILFAGTTLTIPSPGQLTERSPAEAKTLVNNHHQLWHQKTATAGDDALIAKAADSDSPNSHP